MNRKFLRDFLENVDETDIAVIRELSRKKVELDNYS